MNRPRSSPTATILLLLISLILLPTHAESARDVGEALSGFDAFVESVMKEWEIPGSL